MQGDPVAFTVRDDRAEAVRRDRVLGLEHLATVRLRRRDGRVEPAAGVDVDQWAEQRRRDALLGLDQAAADLVALVLEQPEVEAGAADLVDGLADDRAVERDRTIEVDDGDVDPDESVAQIGRASCRERVSSPV